MGHPLNVRIFELSLLAATIALTIALSLGAAPNSLSAERKTTHQHGIAMHGELKYDAKFPHLELSLIHI